VALGYIGMGVANPKVIWPRNDKDKETHQETAVQREMVKHQIVNPMPGEGETLSNDTLLKL
jgi:hypothetical protein